MRRLTKCAPRMMPNAKTKAPIRLAPIVRTGRGCDRVFRRRRFGLEVESGSCKAKPLERSNLSAQRVAVVTSEGGTSASCRFSCDHRIGDVQTVRSRRLHRSQRHCGAVARCGSFAFAEILTMLRRLARQ
jgi:hypothetical protein